MDPRVAEVSAVEVESQTDRPATIAVVLPAAPPEGYLRWMAYWREVEQAMAERPALERHASAMSAPFVREPFADHLSGVWVTSIIQQATDAKREGAVAVSPDLEGSPADLLRAADYVERRGRWLHTTVVVEAMGIRPLEPHLVRLRADCVKALRDQVRGAGA
jgi:hypothetical protein